VALGTDRWPSTITDYFNALRKRDLCNNNEKYMFSREGNNVPS